MPDAQAKVEKGVKSNSKSKSFFINKTRIYNHPNIVTMSHSVKS